VCPLDDEQPLGRGGDQFVGPSDSSRHTPLPTEVEHSGTDDRTLESCTGLERRRDILYTYNIRRCFYISPSFLFETSFITFGGRPKKKEKEKREIRETCIFHFGCVSLSLHSLLGLWILLLLRLLRLVQHRPILPTTTTTTTRQNFKALLGLLRGVSLQTCHVLLAAYTIFLLLLLLLALFSVRVLTSSGVCFPPLSLSYSRLNSPLFFYIFISILQSL
jgi:hypothetical protein